MNTLQKLHATDMPFVNTEIEIYLLGSMLIDTHAIDRLSLTLRPEHFALDMHQIIYKTMLKIGDSGKPTDIGLVFSTLMNDGNLDRIGGHQYLTNLWRIEASSCHVDHYAETVIDLAKRRRVATIQQAISVAHPDELDDLEVELHEARRDEKNIAELVSLESGLKAQNERLDRQLSGEKPPRWTGFHALDHRLMRWEKGDLIIVAALTGYGKTAFALNVTYHLLKNEGKRVCFFSLEMSDIQIADRLVGLDANIPVEQIQDGEFTPDEMQRYAVSQGRLAGMPIMSSYDSAITVEDIRRKVHREHKLKPFDLVVVDYLGLMTGSGENRTQEVSKMSMALKALAKDLNVPILAAHQLNRGADEQRVPKLSDLKDSSTIEQSSNTVLLLHHDDEEPDRVDVIVGKNRQRKKGTIQLHWNGPLMRFSDIEYGRSGE